MDETRTQVVQRKVVIETETEREEKQKKRNPKKQAKPYPDGFSSSPHPRLPRRLNNHER